jgi:RNA polymerase sigma factor (sigma-70 family)
MTHEEFEQIVLEYQNLVYTVCLNIVKDRGDAENMAQETFLAAYNSLPGYRGGSLKSWLCRIAVNKSIDYKRKQSLYILEELDGSEAHTGESVEQGYERLERAERLERILSELPEKYAEVIRAFYYIRLTVKEISMRLKLPERTVETRLYRAKKLIRERWGESEL